MASEASGGLDPSVPVLSQVGSLGDSYMSWVNVPVSGQPRFFRSDALEGLSKVRWWVVPAFWGPILGATIIRCVMLPETAVAYTMAAFSVGVVFWQLLEYCIHRHLFHVVPQSYWAITWHFAFHGCHHKYPRDKERLVFPPAPAILVALAIYFGLHAALPQAIALPLFSGILAGYLSYDCIHYAIHHGGRLPTRWLMHLRSAHLSHHYRDPDTGYGISSNLFDIVFGTCVPPRS